MKAYAQLEKYDELMVYLGRLDESLSQVDQVIKTGNLMADAILNSKLGLMKSRNIHTDVTVHVPEQMKTSDMDLCVLVGNLLDNAIEACDAVKEEENRFIRIYIDTLQNQLYISIMNGMEGTARRQGARFVSSKRGDRRQGFGLQQVDLQKSIGERGWELPVPLQCFWTVRREGLTYTGMHRIRRHAAWRKKWDTVWIVHIRRIRS